MKVTVAIAACLLAMPLSASAADEEPGFSDLVTQLKPKPVGPDRGIRKIAPAAGAEAVRPAEPLIKPAIVSEPAVPSQPKLASNRVVAPPQTDLASVSLPVQFETGSERLTPAARRTLDALGRALASPDLASYHFRIEGHTDTVGNHDANVALSARRAATVSDYIVGHYGVDRARLSTVGFGPDHLAIATPDGVAEPKNRRVQVVNVGS